MKKILSILFLSAFLLSSKAQTNINVVYSFLNGLNQNQRVVQVSFTPMSLGIYSNAFVIGDENYRVVTGNKFTNQMLSGFGYRVKYFRQKDPDIITAVFTNWFGTNVSGTVNATDYVAISTNLGNGIYAYSMSQADARFAPIGSSGGFTNGGGVLSGMLTNAGFSAIGSNTIESIALVAAQSLGNVTNGSGFKVYSVSPTTADLIVQDGDIIVANGITANGVHGITGTHYGSGAALTGLTNGLLSLSDTNTLKAQAGAAISGSNYITAATATNIALSQAQLVVATNINPNAVINNSTNANLNGIFSGSGSGFTKLPVWPKKFLFDTDSKHVAAWTNRWWTTGNTNTLCTAFTNRLLNFSSAGAYSQTNSGFAFLFGKMAMDLAGQPLQVDTALCIPGKETGDSGIGYDAEHSMQVDQPSYSVAYSGGSNTFLIYCGSGMSYKYWSLTTNDDRFVVNGQWFTNFGTNFTFTPTGSGGYLTALQFRAAGSTAASSTNIVTMATYPGQNYIDGNGNTHRQPPYVQGQIWGTNNNNPNLWLITNSPLVTGISCGYFLNGGGNDRAEWGKTYGGNNILFTNRTTGLPEAWQWTFTNIVYKLTMARLLGYSPVVVSTYDVDPGFIGLTNTFLGAVSYTNLLWLNTNILTLKTASLDTNFISAGRPLPLPLNLPPVSGRLVDYLFDEAAVMLPLAQAEKAAGLYTNYMVNSTAHWLDYALTNTLNPAANQANLVYRFYTEIGCPSWIPATGSGVILSSSNAPTFPFGFYTTQNILPWNSNAVHFYNVSQSATNLIW